MKFSSFNQKGIAPISIIIFVVILLVAGGVGWYYMSHHTVGNPAMTATTTDSLHPTSASAPTTAGVTDMTGTMSDLIGRGQSLECDWHLPNQTANNPMNAGKVWTTGNKGRSTVTANVSGMAMEANAIFMDGTAYSWVIVGGNKMGFKINPTQAQQLNSSMTPQQRQQAQQVRQNMLFNCHPWTPDESKFVLPSDVHFQ